MPSCRLLVSHAHLTLILLAVWGCAQRGNEVAPESTAGDVAKVDVVLDPSIRDLDSRVITAWQFYGLLKAKVFELEPSYRDDYWIEARSRGALATYWAEEGQKKGGASDPYLDALVEVQRAGHMEEYVLATLARPGWTIPADMFDALDIEAFAAWSRERLAGHEVETHAAVRRAGAGLDPVIPGDDLPGLDDLAKGGALCAELPRAAAAYAEWREREAKLPGVALASRERGAFLATLVRLRASGSARGRQVTWVSPKAADLSYLVGFCEVDRNRRDASVDPLETAVRLEPLTPMWRLELAGSLTSVQRFDDAAREIEIVLAQTDDRCILGGAWRRKGFLEIERGQLAQAELSYRKSLEYEPGNHIALSELSVILQQRVKRGDAPAGETYTPPPSTAPTQSSCPRR